MKDNLRMRCGANAAQTVSSFSPLILITASIVLFVLPSILSALEICPVDKLPTEITIEHVRHPRNLATSQRNNWIEVTVTLSWMNSDTGVSGPMQGKEVMIEISLLNQQITMQDGFLKRGTGPFILVTDENGQIKIPILLDPLLSDLPQKDRDPRKISYSITANYAPAVKEPFIGSNAEEKYSPSVMPPISLAACLPLFLVLAFLMAAMQASGRNPFGFLDISRFAFRGPGLKHGAVKKMTIAPVPAEFEKAAMSKRALMSPLRKAAASLLKKGAEKLQPPQKEPPKPSTLEKYARMGVFGSLGVGLGKGRQAHRISQTTPQISKGMTLKEALRTPFGKGLKEAGKSLKEGWAAQKATTAGQLGRLLGRVASEMEAKDEKRKTDMVTTTWGGGVRLWSISAQFAPVSAFVGSKEERASIGALDEKGQTEARGEAASVIGPEQIALGNNGAFEKLTGLSAAALNASTQAEYKGQPLPVGQAIELYKAGKLPEGDLKFALSTALSPSGVPIFKPKEVDAAVANLKDYTEAFNKIFSAPVNMRVGSAVDELSRQATDKTATPEERETAAKRLTEIYKGMGIETVDRNGVAIKVDAATPEELKAALTENINDRVTIRVNMSGAELQARVFEGTMTPHDAEGVLTDAAKAGILNKDFAKTFSSAIAAGAERIADEHGLTPEARMQIAAALGDSREAASFGKFVETGGITHSDLESKGNYVFFNGKPRPFGDVIEAGFNGQIPEKDVLSMAETVWPKEKVAALEKAYDEYKEEHINKNYPAAGLPPMSLQQARGEGVDYGSAAVVQAVKEYYTGAADKFGAEAIARNMTQEDVRTDLNKLSEKSKNPDELRAALGACYLAGAAAIKESGMDEARKLIVKGEAPPEAVALIAAKSTGLSDEYAKKMAGEIKEFQEFDHMAKKFNSEREEHIEDYKNKVKKDAESGKMPTPGARKAYEEWYEKSSETLKEIEKERADRSAHTEPILKKMEEITTYGENVNAILDALAKLPKGRAEETPPTPPPSPTPTASESGSRIGDIIGEVGVPIPGLGGTLGVDFSKLLRKKKKKGEEA